MSHVELPQFADEGEVILGIAANHDGDLEAVHLKILPQFGIEYGVVGIFPPHQISGDPTRARHLLLSEFVQSNWAGGGQVAKLQESTDVDRFDFATLDSRWPHTLALLPLTTKLDGPNTDGAKPLGMFDGEMVVAYGTELRVINATPGLDAGGALGATPNDNGAVEYRGSGTRRLFIPCGTTYKTWDGTSVAAGTAGIEALSFLVWNDQLLVLETDGTIKVSLDGTTWGNPGGGATVIQLEPGWIPRSLQLFRDRADNFVPYVVTDSHLWALDPGTPMLVRTDMDPPRHPYHGLASAPFDNELWIGAGIGMYAYSGPSKRPVGPDRGDSLPKEYRGTTVSLAPFLNGMVALMRGSLASTNEEQEITHDDAEVEGDAYVSGSVSQSLLMVWDRRAWHTLWTGAAAGTTPTRVDVETKADGTYRLWWGFGGALYWQDISTDFLNPKLATTQHYEQRGTLWFGEFDGGNEAQEKTAASIEVRTRKCTATETITIRYSTDGGQTYTTIGTISDNGDDGQTVINLGNDGDLPDGTPWDEGIDFHQFKVAVDFARGDDDTKTPILESLAVVYFPKMGDLDSWNFVVDCSSEYKGRGPRDIKRHLKRLIGEKFVPFGTNDEWQMVKVTGVSGVDATGQDLSGNRRVSVVQARED